jgi:ATP-dependent exoDNAse (exonuclease V) beta subunit
MWSLSKPILNFDFILFDEAQDANPAISSVIEVQPNQVIMVGDSAQAIYGWRGAVDAMSRFKDMGATVLTLSQSFRFGEAIAAEANRFLDLLDAALRLKGFEQTDSTVGEVEEPDAILCRTNASVIEYAMDAQARDRKVAIVGGTKEIETFAKNADKLINGGKVFSGDLAGFDSWEDVRTFSQQEDGKDLRVMVKLVDTYGIPAILEVCQNSTSEGDADVIVSTAHKAKGREWDSVKIAADFLRNTDGEEPSRAELMLMYVAVTRAKVNLDQGVLALV